MFEWKVEDMKLMNESKTLDGVFHFEKTISKEDKIAFIDSFKNGKLTYIITMIQKFESEKDSLPKDRYGYVKTVSLKAWLRKNDVMRVFQRESVCGCIGEFFISGASGYIQSDPLNKKQHYSYIHSNIIDEAFHRQLLTCEKMEKEYFYEHDEYSILKNRFLNLIEEYNTSFGVHISHGFGLDASVKIVSDTREYRDITIEELKTLISLYDRLDMFIQSLSSEIDIKY